MRLLLITVVLILLAGLPIRAEESGTIPPEPTLDLRQIIDLDAPEDAAQMRQNLLDFIWCGSLPSALPQVDLIPGSNAHMSLVWRIQVDMDYGLESIGRLYQPPVRNDRLIVYHNGHAQGLRTYPDVLHAFLDAGFDVAEFTMPGIGENRPLVVDEPDFGRIRLSSYHASFAMIQPPVCGDSIKYFLEPVTVFLNYAEQQGYQDISMVGLSGGGWTTTLVAAIDTRVSRSFPVAGSLPQHLRITDQGDWEQFHPPLYRIANYLELYLLASHPGREQLQITNLHDPCCFGSWAPLSYQPTLREMSGELGGVWDGWIDESHKQHIVSPEAIKRILSALDTVLPAQTKNEQSWLPMIRGE